MLAYSLSHPPGILNYWLHLPNSDITRVSVQLKVIAIGRENDPVCFSSIQGMVSALTFYKILQMNVSTAIRSSFVDNVIEKVFSTWKSRDSSRLHFSISQDRRMPSLDPEERYFSFDDHDREYTPSLGILIACFPHPRYFRCATGRCVMHVPQPLPSGQYAAPKPRNLF
jgi:hypothetical protein